MNTWLLRELSDRFPKNPPAIRTLTNRFERTYAVIQLHRPLSHKHMFLGRLPDFLKHAKFQQRG
jgi:hypothetical protein